MERHAFPQKLKKITSFLTNLSMIFFVAYSVLQCTAASLTISNDIIIAGMFLILCLHILAIMLCNGIRLFPKKNKQSIFSFLKKFDYIVLFFLAVNAIWILFIPRMNGFPLRDAVAEAGMLMMFVLYFPLAILIRMGEFSFHKIVRIFFWSVFLLACWHSAMWVAEAIHPGAMAKYFEFLSRLPLIRTGEILIGWGIIRIVISNSILLGCGMLLLFAKQKKVGVFDIIAAFLFTFAILSTFLKSLWLGALLGCGLVGCFLIYSLIKNRDRQFIRNAVVLFSVILISAIALNVTIFQGSVSHRLNNAFIHSSEMPTEPDEEDDPSIIDKDKDTQGAIVSNNIKLEQTKRLLEKWSEQPLLGFGYGSYIEDYLRSNTVTFAYEMTTFSLLMKTGAVGFAVWALLAVWALVRTFLLTRKRALLPLIIWLAVTGCYLVSIQTNPYLFTANSIGLLIYLLLFSVSMEKKKETMQPDALPAGTPEKPVLEG